MFLFDEGQVKLFISPHVPSQYGLLPDCGISSGLEMTILQSCNKQSIVWCFVGDGDYGVYMFLFIPYSGI